MVRILLVPFFVIVFSVFLGHFTSVEGQEKGILTVTTTPVRGGIYVDKIFKGTNYWSGNISVGSHVVSFGNVDGYIAPSPQTVSIIADQTYYVIGSYRKLFSLLQSVRLVSPPRICRPPILKKYIIKKWKDFERRYEGIWGQD
jgi:hypothetical protein